MRLWNASRRDLAYRSEKGRNPFKGFNNPDLFAKIILCVGKLFYPPLFFLETYLFKFKAVHPVE